MLFISVCVLLTKLCSFNISDGLGFLCLTDSDFTPEQVADFLNSNGFGQYSQSFKKCKMDGETLVGASGKELSVAGVQSRLHQVKIITLFKRHYTGESPTRFVH